jgi:phosphate transport system substrate-binding protein
MASHRCRAAAASLAVAAALSGVSLTIARAGELVVQGSTTFNANVIVPHQAAIEKDSGHVLKVSVNKSSAGLIALLEKRADLAMISAPLEDEVRATRKMREDLDYGGLRSFEIGRVRIAFAMNAANTVREASLDVVRRILIGEVANWKELGGPDLPIRVVAVRHGGGVQTTVEAKLLGGKPVDLPNVILVQHASQVIKVVEQEPGALGIAQLAALRSSNLPELATNEVIEQQLNLVTAGEPTPDMMQVIEAARRRVAGHEG